MPAIGIMRYGCDNDYLFIAKKMEDDSLEEVAFYHENTSSVLGMAGPWKTEFPSASLMGDRKVLVSDGEIIFSGDEEFNVFEIPDEKYEEIFAFDTVPQIPAFAEYERILTAASEAGFMPRIINGAPRAVSHGVISISEILKD